ncbi:hypothetical protein Tco_0526429 [Tanacetum coccineum]
MELTPAEAIQADCDIKAINIILQGLPTEIYALVSQHRVAKDLWEKIKLLMQGTSLTKQERECKLYDEFDKFTYKKGESLHEYYLRFTLLLNDMNIYKMPLEQFQVNTKFLNTLPDEWSKFVTDVKLVKDLHTTNVDQLHAYLEQHERHANEVRLMHECNSDPLALVASHQITQSPYQTHQHTYQNTQLQPPASTYPSPQGDKLLLLRVLQGLTLQEQVEAILENRGRLFATTAKGKIQIFLKVKAHRLSLLIMLLSADDWVAYDLICDDLYSANSFFMANLSHYGSDALAEVHNHDNMNNDVVNQAVQMMPSSQQSNVVNHSETEITSDSNIIPYSYKSVNDTLTAELERYKEQVKVLKEGQNVDLRSKDNISDTCAENSVSNQSVPSFDQLFELNELKAQSQEKDTEKALAITSLKDELWKLKGKALVYNNISNHPSDPELHQVNVEPITPKLLNKRTAHSAYIKHSQEEAIVLRDLVNHIKANYPLDPLLESAYKYAKLIQEMLSKISKTYPSINSSGEQLVVVILMNKVKRVRFIEPVTSSRNTKIAHTSNLASNTPMLSSTRVKQSTSASGSQPSGNTKNDRIQQTPSSTLKNKVEAHPRKVKSSLKNKDCVVAPKGTAHVQHSKLNANYELKCVKCNGCMLSDNHDLCVLDFIELMITITTEVPLRKSSALDNKTPKPVVTLVYSRKPRKSKTSVPVNNYKVIQIVLWYLDSGCSKHMTGDRSQLTNFVNNVLG